MLDEVHLARRPNHVKSARVGHLTEPLRQARRQEPLRRDGRANDHRLSAAETLNDTNTMHARIIKKITVGKSVINVIDAVQDARDGDSH